MKRTYYTLWAKDWGIDELEFIDSYDTHQEAAAAARRYREEYPEDKYGWPCSYLVKKDEPRPEPGIPYEQLSAAGLV